MTQGSGSQHRYSSNEAAQPWGLALGTLALVAATRTSPNYGVEPSCIACMFFGMTASAVRSSSLGLNHTNSVPGSCCSPAATRAGLREAGLDLAADRHAAHERRGSMAGRRLDALRCCLSAASQAGWMV